MKYRFEHKIQNGQQYIQYPNSTQWVLLFTLSDGQKITVRMLSDKLSCNLQCARARLRRTSDPELVFKPILRTRKNRHDGGGSTKRGVFAFDPSTWFEDPLVKLMLK